MELNIGEFMITILYYIHVLSLVLSTWNITAYSSSFNISEKNSNLSTATIILRGLSGFEEKKNKKVTPKC